MIARLSFQNRQRTRKLDLRFLRKITSFLLEGLLSENQFDLGFRLVGKKEMARVNEQFLQHSGSTDVITFDYGENDFEIFPENDSWKSVQPVLHGEIFICIDDAIQQAREFKTTWQSELVRYVVHGILHLKGFDDLTLRERKKMKREENRILREISGRFALSKLQRPTKTPA
jgi:probable rRNA maturation factor